MDLQQATTKLQECVNYLQAEGFTLDIKVGLKPLTVKKEDDTKNPVFLTK